MKKARANLILLLITVMISFSACHQEYKKEINKGYELGTQTRSLDNWDENISLNAAANAQFVCLAMPKPIDEIMANSYIIAKVEIDSVEKVEQDFLCSLGTLYDYKSTILEFLKGEIQETEFDFQLYSLISVYHDGSGNEHIFKEGHEYILFITKIKSIYFGDRYGVDSLIFETKDGKIINQYQHGNMYTDRFFITEEDFKDFLKENTDDTAENGKCFGCDYIESDSIKEIVGFSEVIVKANLTEVITSNGKTGLCNVMVQCIETYKGQMPEKRGLLLFDEDVRAGEDALILLSTEIYANGEEYHYSVSSKNSVIYEDDDRYEKYLAYIGLDNLMRKDYPSGYGQKND